MQMPATCDICDETPIKMARDRMGSPYAACAAHVQYLLGWVRDANREMDCDAIAGRSFERRVYGED